MANAYNVRFYAVYSTYWRRSTAAVARPREFDLSDRFQMTERFKSFYLQFKGQIPELLAQRIFDLEAEQVTFRRHFRLEPMAGLTWAEVALFSLPFPSDQIVATVVLGCTTRDLNDDSTETRKILAACTESEIHVDGRSINDIVNALAEEAHAKPERPSDPKERMEDTPQERHILAFIADLAGVAPPSEETVAGMLYGIQPPYRPEFTKLERPVSLNLETGTFAAVSPTASFFYGFHGPLEIVESSVLLTTVQAVGTASRFQRIWRDAYFQVRQFQAHKQAKIVGEQGRADLEALADEIGNLELDLAFSVETAADLGLGSTTSRIDDFHEDLYHVMQIKTRANTVSKMFIRLGRSVRSELTAIESREQEENDQRFRDALMLSFLNFFLAPISLVLGFLTGAGNGENTPIFDVQRNWLVYILAGLIMIIISAAVALTLKHTKLRKAFGRPFHRLGTRY